MKRRWLYLLLVSLIMTLLSIDVAAAKKSRSSRASAHSNEKRDSKRGKAGKNSSRGGKVSRKSSRRGEVARGRRGRSSKRREVARSGRSSGTREITTSASDSYAPRSTSNGIPTERVAEIQNALIKAGFMSGPATGQYDDTTTGAMKQFQSTNGLPQTGLPSAILLKKLGVSKRSNDGYAVPVTRVSETDKKPPEQ